MSIPCKDHKGQEYKSISEKCRHYNINVGTYYSRKKKGLPEEECLKLVGFVYKGKQYKTTEKCEKDIGRRLHHSKTKKNLKRGVPVKEAFVDKGFYYKNVWYKNIQDYSTRNNISRSIIYNLLGRYDLDVVAAIDWATSGRHKNDRAWHKSEPFVIEGIEYSSVRQFCLRNGIYDSTVSSLRRRGLTLQEACLKALNNHRATLASKKESEQ